MPEIGTFGLMSGDGKRSVGKLPQATAPILDSTGPAVHRSVALRQLTEQNRTFGGAAAIAAALDPDVPALCELEFLGENVGFVALPFK
jgi:hypothetical protein